MYIPISPVALLVAAFALAATATALPSAAKILPRRQNSTATPPLFNETTSLPYVFTVDAFLFSDPFKFIPFGFRRTEINSLGSLGRKSKFALIEGKLVIRSKNKDLDLDLDLDLEVGAPALRQGVVLLPRGEGVPVRAVVVEFEGAGVKETVIEVDDESQYFFLFIFLFCLFCSFIGRLGNIGLRKNGQKKKRLLINTFYSRSSSRFCRCSRFRSWWAACTCKPK